MLCVCDDVREYWTGLDRFGKLLVVQDQGRSLVVSWLPGNPLEARISMIIVCYETPQIQCKDTIKLSLLLLWFSFAIIIEKLATVAIFDRNSDH